MHQSGSRTSPLRGVRTLPQTKSAIQRTCVYIQCHSMHTNLEFYYSTPCLPRLKGHAVVLTVKILGGEWYDRTRL